MYRHEDYDQLKMEMPFGVTLREDMERKLRLLFVPECGWALDYDFDLGELVIFPRFPDVPAIQ